MMNNKPDKPDALPVLPDPSPDEVLQIGVPSQDSGDMIGLSRSRNQSNDGMRPHVLTLTSPETTSSLKAMFVGLDVGEGFVLKALGAGSEAAEALRTVPTVALLADRAEHLETIHALKQEEGFRDVPMFYLLGTGHDPGAPRAYGAPNLEEMARRALRAGCDEVIHEALGQPHLVRSLEAIWTYYKGHGFAPPSGHNFVFSRVAAQDARRRPEEGDHITLYGTHEFSPGKEGSPHVLLVSNDDPYRNQGLALLRNLGCHVSYVDSGFLALHFLQKLAMRAAPDTPDALQGKLDLVIVALEGSLGSFAPLVRKVKASVDFADVPVLLISTQVEGHELLQPYHNQRVFMAVDPEPLLEDLVFRIHEIFHGFGDSPRVSSRHLHMVTCLWRPVGDPDGAWEHAISYNLSPRGLYLRSMSPPPQGQALELRFRLRPHSFLLEVAGPVVWSNPWHPTSRQSYPPGFAVMLREGLGSHLEALADFCDFLRESSWRPRKGE